MSPAALILAAVLPSLAAAAPARDPDFEPERPTPSAAMGPAPGAGAVFSTDVGWLRSGVTLHFGVAASFDVAFVADTMLLYRGFHGHTGFRGGVRYSPIAEGTFRLSVELTAGKLLVPVFAGTELLTTFGGELVAGVVLAPANVYARVALRSVASASSVSSAWGRDEEVGLGVERVFGRYAAGAEVYEWARPGQAGIVQWRLRGTISF